MAESGAEQFDAIIIGSGQGGGPLSTALGGAGLKTAIVEREHVGGTCINEGCTPTKTMVASARVAYLARRAADYGVSVPSVNVDMAAVRQRKRDIVESWRSGSQRRIERSDNVELIFGEARFTGPHELDIEPLTGGHRALSAERIVINTGARPASPPVPGLADVPSLNSTTIMELDTVPGHLVVMGGGYVGLEFGQMFRRFGSRVTIVQRGARLLDREDGDVADAVADIMREDGIEVLLKADVASAARIADGGVALAVRNADGERTIEGTHLLVAVGRAPNIEALNLDAAGIKTNQRGYIEVNNRLETSAAGIYAIGDVNGGPAFTHISYDDFRILRANLVKGGNATTDERLVPYTVYIDPQLGRVGLREAEARDQGRKVRVAKMPMNHVARALEVDEPRGFMKVLVEAESDRILGCAILGIEGGELMSMIEIAMLGNVPFTALRDAVFAHPALSESFNNLFASLE